MATSPTVALLCVPQCRRASSFKHLAAGHAMTNLSCETGNCHGVRYDLLPFKGLPQEGTVAKEHLLQKAIQARDLPVLGGLPKMCVFCVKMTKFLKK